MHNHFVYSLIGGWVLFGLGPCAAATLSSELCQHFSRILSNVTILPSSPQYTQVSEENWSATAWGKPSCIVRPAGVTEAQMAVRELTRSNVQFAVRSGGHMPSPKSANIDSGILIDLSGLNFVNYEPISQTVSIGAGQTWGDVYKALDPHKVTVVGGRVLDVGVGGLAQGGGLSWLSDLYGLVCDNVIEHQVLLENGSLVTASGTQNPDLHWALKGGANNFGIVTAYNISTYAIHQVWGGIKFYSLEQLPELFEAMYTYQTAPNKDLYANLMLQAFTTNTSVGAVLNMVYLKPVVSPLAFAPFYSIKPTKDTTKLQTLTEMMAGQIVPPLSRWDWFSTTFKPGANLYQQVANITRTAPQLKQIKSLNGGSVALGVQPISQNVVLAGQARGGNALGLPPVNHTWFVLDTGWEDATGDDTAHESTRKIHDTIQDAAVSANLHTSYIFMNDASYDQPVISSYGATNVARLKEVQSKYDSSHVFQRLVPGGFKLD